MKWLKRLFLPVYTRTYPWRNTIVIKTYIGMGLVSELQILSGFSNLAKKKKEQIDNAKLMRKRVYNC